MITPYEGYVAVAEHLNRLTPGSGEKRSALFNSGSEAVENAIKIARTYTRKQAVVSFDHAYHGRTNLTMALTAKSMPYKHGFGPFAPEIYRAPLSYPFRDAEFGKELATDGELAAKRAINVIDKQVGADNLAAVIIEPIQGEGGFIVPADGFLPALLDWCRENDVVFIADEVQTGFARTGAMFACEHEGIEPDLIVTAKGIADGLPLSAVTGRAEIMDAPHVSGLGGTYGGNPVACAAALATIETIEADGLVERARQIETADEGPAAPAAGRRRPHRRRPRSRRDDRHGAGEVRHHRTRRRAHQEAGARAPHRGRNRAVLRHVRQRAALPAAADHQRRPSHRRPRRARRCPRRPLRTGADMTTVQNFIGGELVDSVSGTTMPLVDPTTGEEYGTAPVSNEQDIDNAYAAASKAFADWKRTTPSHRQKALLDFADDVEKNAQASGGGRGPQHRQAQPRHHGRRDPADGRPDPVLRRCGKDVGGQVGGRVHGEPHLVDPPRAGRRHRPGGAVELPDDDGDLEVLPGHRRRQHRRDQAE